MRPSEQSALTGETREFGAVGEPGFVEDVADVAGDGGGADYKFLADCVVAETLGDEADDLDFAVDEAGRDRIGSLHVVRLILNSPSDGLIDEIANDGCDLGVEHILKRYLLARPTEKASIRDS